MITFYDPRDPWGFFSNFSRHVVSLYGRTWMTSEHAFQAMKFNPHRADLVNLVHRQVSPGKAASVGRDRSNPIRPDWDSTPRQPIPEVDQPNDRFSRAGGPIEPLFLRTKDVVMYEVCWAKFDQHKDLREALLETGDEPLVEDALHDPYWGWGSGRIGQNKLGRVLMAVRDSFRTGRGVPF